MDALQLVRVLRPSQNVRTILFTMTMGPRYTTAMRFQDHNHIWGLFILRYSLQCAHYYCYCKMRKQATNTGAANWLRRHPRKKISLTGTNRLITPGISVTLDIRHFHVRSLVIQTTVHRTGITHFPDISVAHRFLSRVLSRLSVLFLSCPDLNLLSVSFWASVYHVRQYGIATSVFCTPMNENTFHCKLSSCVVSLNFSVAC